MLNDDVIAFKDPKSVAAESYRALRTNLEFSMSSNHLNTVLVTSSHVSEGKSSVCSNLGTLFAMQDKKVIIVDADMRRGTQHEKFGLSNKDGLSSFLANLNTSFEKIIKKTEVPNLFVITSGPIPPNPSELISSQNMKDLLQVLKESFDFVIIDGAPVLPVTDSVILSAICDKVVLVVSSEETHKDELKSAKKLLVAAGANIAGVVLNKVDFKQKNYKYNKHGYYNSYYNSSDDKE